MQIQGRRITDKSAMQRRGVAIVEGALIVTVLFLTLFTMLDLGLAVLRYNSLTEASSRVARAAIVHGENAPAQLGVWGPESYSATADDDSKVAAAARPVLVAVDPASVRVFVEWPDGHNRIDDRVRVSLQQDYQPLFSFGFIKKPITLTATSTLRIAH